MAKKVHVNITVQVDNKKLREATLEDKKYKVVPVVMLVEGVHHGQGEAGAVFYSAGVLKEYHMGWNGRPVTLFHPEDEDGNFLSANIPDVVEKQALGKIYNAKFEDNKLKAEAWFDIDKTNTIAPDLLGNIADDKEIEVSTGLWLSLEEEGGTWNEEEYDGKVIEMLPDHLAALPGKEGACSWADGCGLRTNQKGGKKKWDVKNLKSFIKKIFRVSNKDDSLFDKLDLLRSALYAETDSLDVYQYIIDVYDDYLIYERYGKGVDEQLFKRAYSIDGENVKFGDPVEVRLEKKYVEVINQSGNKEATGNMCCKDRVKALIANDKNSYTEDDKEWLEGLKEDQFVKVELSAHEPVVVKPADNEKGDPKPEDKKPVGIEDLSPELQQTVNWALGQEKARKDGVIVKIMANENNKFKKEELDVKPIDELNNLVALMGIKEPPVDYSLGGGSFSRGDDKIPEPMAMPTLQPKKDKE